MGTIAVNGLGKAYKQYPSRWARLVEWLVPFAPQRHQLKWVLSDITFAVAPGLTAAALRAQLRHRLDPIFMPRPLVLLDALPRNSTGKLTRETIETLAKAHLRAGTAHGRQVDGT